MKTRRDFIKTTALSSLAGTALVEANAPAKTEDSIFIEAAHFVNHGGWKLDTQFHNVLGFSYLLAHGMGDPVPNAITDVHFSKPGIYHVWVHTKDWCPGDWKSPGRFNVLVEKQSVGTEFGTEEGWGWQYGGTIEVTDKTLDSFAELQDLTGFEGRCSGIYFTPKEDDKPPTEKDELIHWRRAQLGLPMGPSEEVEFDFVVVGGGMTGCGAALAAEERGLKVAILHNRPVLGGNASGEIRVHTEGIYGNEVSTRILERIDRSAKGNGHAIALLGDRKRHDAIQEANGVTTYLMSPVISLEMDGKKIASVDALEIPSGKIRRFKAPVFLDSSGDGWLGAMSGCEYRYGRESKHEFNEGWDKHGDLWSPEEEDNRILGTSVMWNSKQTDQPSRFPDVPWATPVAKNCVETEGQWQWEFSHNDLHQIDDAEAIRDHMFRAVYGTFANAKRLPQNANLELHWVAFVGGKRESRRIVGDHLFTGRDAADSVEFEDTVVTEKRHIDSHYQEKLTGSPLDFISKALFLAPVNKYYHIPYRSLYARDVDNLFIAGRCFSCTHIGLAGPRVMLTCGQMGIATGYAASLCKEHDSTPRGIYQNHLQALKKLCGYA
ncbi:MAG: FAD-dependent oxidoreductase [Verrucomicrobiota bacterium]